LQLTVYSQNFLLLGSKLVALAMMLKNFDV